MKMGFNSPEGMPLRTPPQRIAAVFDSPMRTPGPMIHLPFSNGLELVPVRQIVRIEADGCYVRLHLLETKKVFCFAKTLKYFDTTLGEYPQFVRIHRSHMINVRYLRTLWRRGQVEAELQDGSLVPVARRRYPNLIRVLEAGW